MPSAKAIRFAALGECMIELRHRDDHTLALGAGGDTLNCAVYLARLMAQRGVRVDYVTALGDDPYSDAMLAQWQAERINTEHVLRVPGKLPGLYMIRTDPQGERTFYYWRAEAAARQMLAGERAGVLTAALAGYDMLYVSGITVSILDEMQRASLAKLLTAARGRGAQVAFDGNFRPRGWPDRAAARRWFETMLGHATIALPTFDDEQMLFGDTDPAATIARLTGYGVREVVVKLGRDGVLLGADGKTERVATAPVEAVDTTAAGDSFNGAYLAARLLGKPPRTAAEAGNRLAGAKVRYPGALMPVDAMPDLGL
jgi:2-dehydro-3-deoxygluconokinase